MPLRLFLTFCVFASTLLAEPHRHSHGAYTSGTAPWKVLDVLSTHELRKLHGSRSISPFGDNRQAVQFNDAGHISVLNDDGSLMAPVNRFDMANTSLRFTPAPGGYRVLAGTDPIDTAAAQNGTRLLLTDDDDEQVQIGFSFPFFGRTYTSLFVNSDGNLTFGSADSASTARTVSRLLTGSPRIAAFFSDLNPEEAGQVTVASAAERFVVSWTAVPQYHEGFTSPGPNTFQMRLFPDGRIEFSYGTMNQSSFASDAGAVVGISPGSFLEAPSLLDLSRADGNTTFTTPIAEYFVLQSRLDEAAVLQRFYETHEDAYDIVIIWTNFSTGLLDGGAFAYSASVSNNITGLGLSREIFDFTRSFGSGSRLANLLMMERLSRYPDDPRAVVTSLGREDNTLSILGQEAGHRWLTFFKYPHNSNLRSTILLGRSDDHWSFFFNSNASVMEGNEIRDNGDGSFTTTDTVKRFNHFDQYAMGIRSPEEVAPSFVVLNPTSGSSGGAPRTGISFRGTRMDVFIDRLIEANGKRLPTSTVSPREFTFAFLMVGSQATPVTPGEIQKLDRIRQDWETFFFQATDGRARANTRLVRGVSFAGLPVATVPGVPVTARLRALAASGTARTFALSSSAPSVSGVPASVTIPANAREVNVPITSSAAGVARISATLDGHETAEGVVVVGSASNFQLSALSGDAQSGAPSARLTNPLVVQLRDPANGLAVAGATINFTGTGVTFSPASAVTDTQGRAQTLVTLGSTTGVFRITASVAGSSDLRANFTAMALVPPRVPAGSAVNAASFAPAPQPVSPGSIISIFGTGLAAETQVATSLPLPNALGGVRVLINGIPAPIFSVSTGQLNVQVPFEITGSTASLVVNNGAGESTPISVPLAPSVPGFFTINQTGTGAGAVLHNDGRLVSTTNPARAGDILQLYLTGLGAVDRPVQTGHAAPLNQISNTLARPIITLSNIPMDVIFSGLAPGFVGLYQVNVLVPAGVRAGELSLIVTAPGYSSNPVTVAIQ